MKNARISRLGFFLVALTCSAGAGTQTVGRLALDPAGNLLVAGATEGSEKGITKRSPRNGSPLWAWHDYGMYQVTADPSGDVVATNGYWVVKVRGTDGVEQWRHYTGSGGCCVTVDAGGDVVAGGAGYILKLSNTGTPEWQVPGASSVAVDRSGDVIGLSPGNTPRKHRGSDGVLLWNYSGSVRGWGFALDASGDVAIGGNSVDTSKFMMAKLSGSTGNEVWRHEFADTDPLAGVPGGDLHAIVVDAIGDVIAAGRFIGALSDLFVVKLAGTDGAELWRYVVAAPGNEEAFSLALDFAGDVMVGAEMDDQRLFAKLTGSSGTPLWGFQPDSSAGAFIVDPFGNLVTWTGSKLIRLRGSTGARYVVACGNGVVEAAEQCDDGNLVDGDGCTALCQLEPATVNGSGTVATGADATPAAPAQAQVTSPSGGSVQITRENAVPSQPGFSMLGVLFQIAAPSETPANPLVITFDIDASLVPPEGAIEVFKNGIAIPGCHGSPGEASPDPCLSVRTTLGNGDLRTTVLTSTASDWSFGFAFGGFGPACGNGNLEPGEECDDGNLSDGDCCTARCTQTIPPEVMCSGALPGKSSLFMRKDPLVATKNLLKWKWTSNAAFAVADLGMPGTTTDVALCVYDADGRVVGAKAPAGGTCAGKPCWEADVTTGKLKYADRDLTPNGLGKIQGKSGSAAAGRLIVQGKGANLPLSRLNLTLPVNARLIRTDTPACWEATFSQSASVKKNDATQFKAKSD